MGQGPGIPVQDLRHGPLSRGPTGVTWAGDPGLPRIPGLYRHHLRLLRAAVRARSPRSGSASHHFRSRSGGPVGGLHGLIPGPGGSCGPAWAAAAARAHVSASPSGGARRTGFWSTSWAPMTRSAENGRAWDGRWGAHLVEQMRNAGYSSLIAAPDGRGFPGRPHYWPAKGVKVNANTCSIGWDHEQVRGHRVHRHGPSGARVVERVHAEGFLRWALQHRARITRPCACCSADGGFPSATVGGMTSGGAHSKIARFVEAHDVRIEEALGDLEDFPTFNEFFTREIDPFQTAPRSRSHCVPGSGGWSCAGIPRGERRADVSDQEGRVQPQKPAG